MDTDPSSLDDTLTTADALSGVMADLETRSQRFGAALTSALKSATVSGSSLESVLKSLGNKLTDIALSSALKPLENSLSSAVGGLIGSATSSVTAFADGGVVRSPSYFSLGSDVGLMGEAGAEAILPLRRGRMARSASPPMAAGVHRSSSTSTATDAASFKKSEGQITAMLARSVARGQRGL